jgi:iron-sulfur cluster repair protein YtfE (RIC family)
MEVATSQDYERFRQTTRAEHEILRRYVDTLREAADAVGDTSLPALRQRVREVQAFLTSRLIPHAEAENQVIYPLLAEVLGSLEGPSAMMRDHLEIGRFAAELAELEPRLSGSRLRRADAKALRRVLYSLAAVLQLHLDQEDAYLGLLGAYLAPEAAESVLESLQDATRKAQARLSGAGPH